MSTPSLRFGILIGVLFVLSATLLLAHAGAWLIADHPAHADLILVLEGEAHYRPQTGLRLLDRGYAPAMLIDADSEMRSYRWTEAGLAQMWVQSLPPADAGRVRVHPENDLSTQTEALHVAPALRAAGVHSVLLVTSDYASHRALLEFQHEIPDLTFSMAAAYDSRRYGLPWWHRREWAKNFLLECTKLTWFELVDRWRGGHA